MLASWELRSHESKNINGNYNAHTMCTMSSNIARITMAFVGDMTDASTATSSAYRFANGLITRCDLRISFAAIFDGLCLRYVLEENFRVNLV